MPNRRGFTLIELLVGLLAMSLLVPTMFQLFRILANKNYLAYNIQDEINLAQLRRVMNVCYEKNVTNDSIECIYENKQVILKVNQNFVYLTPGTWIFISNFDEARFEVVDDLCWLIINRGKNERRALLGIR